MFQACAAQVGAQLQVAPSLDSFKPAGQQQQQVSVGLAGDHQRLNASLAVALVSSWEQHVSSRQQAKAEQQKATVAAAAEQRLQQLQQGVLPQEYLEGLRKAAWPGRSQVCLGFGSLWRVKG